MYTRIFTDNNLFFMLALDHRASFRKMLNPNYPNDTTEQEAIKVKKELIQASYNVFTGVLVDQDYGLPAYQSCEKCEKPFLLPAEESGYEEVNGERITKIKYKAEEMKDMGASGVKLLVYFDPEADTAMEQIRTAKEVLENAHYQKLPLFLEIVTYGHENKVVTESVSMFLENNVRPDVFKIEYPGSPEKCREIQDMLGTTPWILLTSGKDFETFSKDLAIAAKNGCRGFLAGRSLWKEYPELTTQDEKENFLKNIFVPRFNEIVDVVKNSKS